MGCSGNWEYRVYICFFQESIVESCVTGKCVSWCGSCFGWHFCKMLTKKCTTNETMGCSGNGEHRIYIPMFLSREYSGELCEWKVCLLIWVLFWLAFLQNVNKKVCNKWNYGMQQQWRASSIHMFLSREYSGEVCEWKLCLLFWLAFLQNVHSRWNPCELCYLCRILTKKCATNETMKCSGDGEHRVYICFFSESVAERCVNGKCVFWFGPCFGCHLWRTC